MTAAAAAPVPTISAVVVFHDRTEFLADALGSVAAQTGARPTEVVVVGPSDPGSLPADARFVPSKFSGLGGKLADGLRATHGEIVAFLEDDDRWLPERLGFVGQQFARDPHLGYLQNAVRPIGPDGLARSGAFPHHEAVAAWTARGVVEVPARPGARGLRRLAGIPAGFNNSSIVVRRSILASHLADLEAADLHVDLFVLYAALCSELALRLDPTPLTELRVHPGSISQAGGTDQDLGTLRRFLERTEPGRRALAAFARRYGTAAVARAAEGQVVAEQLIYRLRSPESTRGSAARDWLAALSRADTFEVENRRGALWLGAVAVAAPRRASALYLAARRRRDRTAAPEPSSGRP